MKQILKTLKSYRIHLISWMIFMVSESMIIGLASNKFGHFGNYVAHYTINIVLFYFCGNWLYPRILGNRFWWIWKLPVYGTAVFAIYILTNYAIDLGIKNYTSWAPDKQVELSRSYIFSGLWRAIVFMGLSGFYYLFMEYQKEIQNRHRAEQERLESLIRTTETEVQLSHATNAYLKAQINPHLLFNTLNFIYQDILSSSPKAAEAVMTLSDVMRYSTNCEFQADTVPLGEELTQVENLIALQQIRYDNEAFINFDYPDEVSEIAFIPLVLLTLTENIFKHGIFTDPRNPVLLRISLTGRVLEIYSLNLPKKAKPVLNEGGKGLKNIRKRLEIFYGEGIQMSAELISGKFEVRITAELPLTIREGS